MKSRKRQSFVVTCNIPEGCTVKDVREYIDDAVSVWKGSMDPESPIFDFDGNSVRVTVKQPKKSKTTWVGIKE